MKPEIDQGHDDAVKKLPATQPSLESRFSRLELLFYQLARQVDQQAQQIDQHAQQINKLNEFVCIDVRYAWSELALPPWHR